MTTEHPGRFTLPGGLGTSCAGPARPIGRPRRGRVAAAFDSAAGMWTESGWRARAADSVATAPAWVALMLVDPACPQSESAIARCLGGILRPSDPVGRYGTRQVVALVQIDLPAVGILVAARVRARLRDAGIGAVVGLATSVGEGLPELLVRVGSDVMARRESAGISASW